jgi:hypothetical protein
VVLPEDHAQAAEVARAAALRAVSQAELHLTTAALVSSPPSDPASLRGRLPPLSQDQQQLFRNLITWKQVAVADAPVALCPILLEAAHLTRAIVTRRLELVARAGGAPGQPQVGDPT